MLASAYEAEFLKKHFADYTKEGNVAQTCGCV